MSSIKSIANKSNSMKYWNNTFFVTVLVSVRPPLNPDQWSVAAANEAAPKKSNFCDPENPLLTTFSWAARVTQRRGDKTWPFLTSNLKASPTTTLSSRTGSQKWSSLNTRPSRPPRSCSSFWTSWRETSSPWSRWPTCPDTDGVWSSWFSPTRAPVTPSTARSWLTTSWQIWRAQWQRYMIWLSGRELQSSGTFPPKLFCLNNQKLFHFILYEGFDNYFIFYVYLFYKVQFVKTNGPSSCVDFVSLKLKS